MSDRITWKTRLLIIDYNTLHYTSCSALRTELLLHRDLFHHAFVHRPELVTGSVESQVAYFFEHNTERDPYHLVSNTHADFTQGMNALLEKCFQFEAFRLFNTDLNGSLRTALMNQTIEAVHILKHPLDKSTCLEGSDIHIIRTDKLFDAKSIAAYIDHHRLNAVILDSVDLAMDISELTIDTTFLFGSYRYNFLPKDENGFRILRRMEDMSRFERTRHHEYGKFDPYKFVWDYINNQGGQKDVH